MTTQDGTDSRQPADQGSGYDANLLAAIHSLVADLRHELGNPLNSIKAALTLVRRGLTTFPPEKTLSYLDATLTEVGRLEKLLTMLRRLSEPAAKRADALDIEPFLEGFLAQYGYEVERRGIIFESRPVVAAQVVADSEALSQVLLDLMSSAVHRLLRVEEPRLEISAFAQDHHYVIELRSNGRAAASGRELPFASAMLGPREDDYRLALAISRQILLQLGARILSLQPAPQAFVARIELPLALEARAE